MELKWQPFPHRSPTTEALCRPEAAALPGGMAALTAGVARAAVEAARAEVVLTEAVEVAARVVVDLTEEAEARVAEGPVEEAVLQAEVAAAAIARVTTCADRQ